MAASSSERLNSRGYRLRMVFEDIGDFRRKACIHVNPFFHKYVRSILYKVWCLFFKDLCSSPSELVMTVGGYFIPPHETSWILSADDVAHVKVHCPDGDSKPCLAAECVNSSEVVLTDSPATMVESVGITLQRLKDRNDGTELAAVDEHAREKQVTNIVETRSLSTDHSTIEEGGDLLEIDRDGKAGEALVRTRCKLHAIQDQSCGGHDSQEQLEKDSVRETSNKLNAAYVLSKIKPDTKTLHIVDCDSASSEDDDERVMPIAEVCKRKRRDTSSSSSVSESSSDESDPGDGCLSSTRPNDAVLARQKTSVSVSPGVSKESGDDSGCKIDVTVNGARETSNVPPISKIVSVVASNKGNVDAHSNMDSQGKNVAHKSSVSAEMKEGNVPINPSGPNCTGSEPKRRKRRRRRGVKHRNSTEHAIRPDPPPMQHKYVPPCGMSHAEIMLRKRSSSVAINPNNVNRNSAFVFDEEGNLVPKYCTNKMLQQYHDKNSSQKEDASLLSTSSTRGLSQAESACNIPTQESNSSQVVSKSVPTKNFGSLSMIPRGLRAPKTRIAVPKYSDRNDHTESVTTSTPVPCDQKSFSRMPSCELEVSNGVDRRKFSESCPSIDNSAVQAADENVDVCAESKHSNGLVKNSSSVNLDHRVSLSESTVASASAFQTYLVSPDGRKTRVCSSSNSLDSHDLHKLAYSRVEKPLVFIRERSVCSPTPPSHLQSNKEPVGATQVSSYQTNSSNSSISWSQSGVCKDPGRESEGIKSVNSDPTEHGLVTQSLNNVEYKRNSKTSCSSNMTESNSSSAQQAVVPIESVDSISNCNVINEVGQNRRIEKQRIRALGSQACSSEKLTDSSSIKKDDVYYAQFPILKLPAKAGEFFAFKKWDMDENYSPFVTAYQEAKVLESDLSTGYLRLQVLDYLPSVKRRGRFDLDDSDDDEVVDLDREAGIVNVEWQHLITPRLMFP